MGQRELPASAGWPLIHQLTLNQRVQGSSPCAPTKNSRNISHLSLDAATARFMPNVGSGIALKNAGWRNCCPTIAAPATATGRTMRNDEGTA